MPRIPDRKSGGFFFSKKDIHRLAPASVDDENLILLSSKRFSVHASGDVPSFTGNRGVDAA
jgi:hypothetical protein